MRLKRNVAAIIMLLVFTIGTMTVLAYIEKRDTQTYQFEGQAKATAYTFINTSGFGRHNGTSTGSITGTDRGAVDGVVLTCKFGSDSTEYKLGLSTGTYYKSKQKTGWFNSVKSKMTMSNGDEITASVSD